MNNMRHTKTALTALRNRIARLEGVQATGSAAAVLGHYEIDTRLGGGLERGRLHEIFAVDAADASSAAGFAAMIVRRAGPAGSVIWLRQEQAQAAGGALHMPGLVELGLRGIDLIVGMLPDPLSLLRAAADVARCAEVGIVVIELWHDPRLLDLTASRRLAAAAEKSGVTALLLRIAAAPSPSAAATRWAVRAVPAVPLEANAPGHPALEVELMRQRGGRAGGRWVMEWDRDQGIFKHRPAGACAEDEATLSGAVVPVAAGGGAAGR